MKNKIFIFGLFTLSLGCLTTTEGLKDEDIRIFKNTQAWDLAKAINKEDILEIKKIIEDDTVLINFRDPKFGQTLLEWGISTDKYKSSEMLLKLGANPDLRNTYNGKNPLIRAAVKYENPEYLKLLIKYGANPNSNIVPESAKKFPMSTPLITAAGDASLENLKTLVEANADINFTTPEGNTALEEAALMNQVVNVKYLLIEKHAEFKQIFSTNLQGENKYLVDYMREWPFEIGSEEWKCKMEIVAFLKEHGMDYSKAKVPKEIQESYSKDFIEKY